MDRVIYEKVNSGKIQEIRALRSMGAGFEWKDNEEKTPLILASSRHDLFEVAKTLIELGANINAYRPGSNGGTPLHHATMKGHEKTVKLLLASGANPYIKNGDGHTALDLARKRGRFVIVRTIENEISVFSGWLRAECGSVLNGNLSTISSDFRPGKVWVAVLPCDLNDPTWPPNFELAIYLAPEVAQPCEVIKILESHMEQPNFNEADPSLIIEASGIRYRLFSEYWGEQQKFRSFYNSYRGITQENSIDMSPSSQLVPRPVPTLLPRQPHLTNSTPSLPVLESSPINQDEIDLEMAIKASIQTAIAEGILNPNSIHQTGTTGTNVYGAPSQDITIQEEFDLGPPMCTGQIHPISRSGSSSSELDKEEKEEEKGICVICLDERIEAACIPCGHMAGCMKCLKKIEAKNKKCPVCRADIDQVVKIYTV